MSTATQQTFARILGLGAICGLRTMSGPALLSDHLRRGQPRQRGRTPFRWLGAPGVAALLKVLAAGELLADKLPGVPARIAPPALAGRAASGALVGAALAALGGQSRVAGAIAGGVAAVAGAFAGYHARRALTQRLGAPDLPIALLEDAIAVVGGLGLLRSAPRPAAVAGG